MILKRIKESKINEESIKQLNKDDLQKRNIISMISNIRNKIHKNHPFIDEMKVYFMKLDFYSYVKNDEWDDAKDQISFKLKKEIDDLNEILKKLLNLSSFISRK
ncbi:MAG: hypothetical protein JW891_13685 [Candidatus Lokiarchaeota archaeon]|nr:hypothetical protein [Candidatus Lokiarchaeota archaeon]